MYQIDPLQCAIYEYCLGRFHDMSDDMLKELQMYDEKGRYAQHIP